jgi:hypothetical protein
VERGEEAKVLAVQVWAVLFEEVELVGRYANVSKLCAVSASTYGFSLIHGLSLLSTCACNHLKAARLSFLSGVRFVKLYVTDTSGKNLSTQHCIVNL